MQIWRSIFLHYDLIMHVKANSIKITLLIHFAFQEEMLFCGPICESFKQSSCEYVQETWLRGLQNCAGILLWRCG